MSKINKGCCSKNVCPIGIEEKKYDYITLDKWYQDNKNNINIKDLKLIKIDTRGSELRILQGAENLLLSCSLFNNCNIELKMDDNFMKEMNTNFNQIDNLMNKLGFKNTVKDYDSIFIPKNPISEDLTIIYKVSGQLCNQLKNLLSCIRIKQYFDCKFFVEDNTICEVSLLFDLSNYKKQDNIEYNNIIPRSSWRLTIFNKDNNIDKVIDNKFSLMFKDFQDKLFFKNYKNNSIDLLYNSELFSEIYTEYSNIFNNLLINKKILEEVSSFYHKHFNKNTISVHIRSWIDFPPRRNMHNIEKFYKEIDKLSDGINNFFISSDNKDICYQVKKHQEDNNLNNIIIYEENKFTNYEIALIELLLLSKNNILIGSYISTFTEMAFIINYNIYKKVIIL